MSTLHQASHQWATRPSEERFTSLTDLAAKLHAQRAISRALVTSSRAVRAVPQADNRGLMIVGKSGAEYAPSHWAFGQLASLVGAPGGYLRSLPAPVAADCLNYGLQVERDAMDVGLLLTRENDAGELRAATGPRYGRIWNTQVADALLSRFGDGRAGDFRIPGEFGKEVDITKANTTLFAGDRDMFVFLADERNRITLPNRRDGQAGTLARGFFVSNSETGAATLKVKTFLFDYVCCNRIVWGAHELDEINIRHTASAPDRFIEQAMPALLAYADAAESGTAAKLQAAQRQKVERLDTFLASRFGANVAQRIVAAHDADEHRPMESVWDVVTGVTAYARSIPWQAERVAIEEAAGKILDAAEVF